MVGDLGVSESAKASMMTRYSQFSSTMVRGSTQNLTFSLGVFL